MYKIEESLFDNGILAQKVGKLIIPQEDEFFSEKFESTIAKARLIGYNLILFKSKKPNLYLKKYYLDHTKTFFIIKDKLFSRIGDLKKIHDISISFDNNWDEIENLTAQAPFTRFDMDKNINRAVVIKHKIKLLKDLHNNNPDNCFIIKNKEEKIIGYHFASISNDKLILKDIIIDENYRNGFAAIQLINENLNNKKIKKVETKIYNSNRNSLNFFKKLGFKDLYLDEHYFHIWL